MTVGTECHQTCSCGKKMARLPRLFLALAYILGQCPFSDAFAPVTSVANDIHFASKKALLPCQSSRHLNVPKINGGVVRSNLHRLASTASIGAEDEPVGINTTDGSVDIDAYDKNMSTPSFPLVLWRFTRPHTIIGSAIAIPSIFLLAAPTYQSFFTWTSLVSLLYASFPSLLMNLYITGLNQITDVEIDKINVSNERFLSNFFIYAIFPSQTS